VVFLFGWLISPPPGIFSLVINQPRAGRRHLGTSSLGITIEPAEISD
jgi:hypothetical protein